MRGIATLRASNRQSYAPFVKCPVLMLCALRDDAFDYDRAYDTYSRIGFPDGSAIAYSSDSGSCIGPHALVDMDLFLERNLKGREIYIPKPLNISLKSEDGALSGGSGIRRGRYSRRGGHLLRGIGRTDEIDLSGMAVRV